MDSRQTGTDAGDRQRDAGQPRSSLVAAPQSFVEGVETWIFDLDDTLYPRSAGLHEMMVARVVTFIQRLTGTDPTSARKLHLEYYERYGASVIWLSRHHGVKPLDFLHFVHDVDLTTVGCGERIRQAVASLPGRRVVFTNGTSKHAARVLNHLGIADLFEAVCDIEACGFVGKPARTAYEHFLMSHRIDPASSFMFDDRIVNLRVPHEMGMRTVLVGQPTSERPSHVNVIIDDLPDYLHTLAAAIIPQDL